MIKDCGTPAQICAALYRSARKIKGSWKSTEMNIGVFRSARIFGECGTSTKDICLNWWMSLGMSHTLSIF
jgi:hypothetical protein